MAEHCAVGVCSSPVHCKEIGRCFSAPASPAPATGNPYKLPFKVRQGIANKLAEAHGLTQIYALKLVNDTLRNLRAADGVRVPDGPQA